MRRESTDSSDRGEEEDMKTLIIFRHGKSDWDVAFDSDRDRPLTPRGRKAARLMGEFLSSARCVPENAVTSPALRAQDTLKAAVKAGAWRCAVTTSESLYDSSPQTILDLIRSQPDAVGILLLTGHEPTLSETIGRMIGGGNVRLPTAAMARLDFDIESWTEADVGRAQLIWLVGPKLLRPEEPPE
jgi:phosphohistidine phosphatase